MSRRGVLRQVLLAPLQDLHDPLIDQLGHPVTDAPAVLQRGPVDLPLVQAAPADVSQELGSSREQHVVGHDHGTLPKQARVLQQLGDRGGEQVTMTTGLNKRVLR